MNSILADLSNALAGAVETAGSGVVRVEARRRFPSSGVLWDADGTIVTNHHVIQHPDAIRVGLGGERTATARLVGRDETTDIAVLKVDPAELDGLAAPDRGSMDEISVGNLVLALGRPGRRVSATLGIVAALGGVWRTPAGGSLQNYLQTDHTLYPGFSGGALVDVQGRLLGITTSAMRRGVSLTIPNGTIETTVSTILEHGRIPRGYLGIGSYPVRLPAAVAARLEQEEGLLIVGVEPDSPADRAGLLLGDVLLSMAGEPLNDPETLLAHLGRVRVGDGVELGLLRGGSLIRLTVNVGERP